MTAPAPPGWLSFLDDATREKVYAEMRTIGDEELRFFTAGKETPNTIPVGAAFFDETLQGAVRMGFLSALRKGKTPDQAVVLAKEEARLWIGKHNARRSKDVDWQRWEGAGDSLADDLGRRIKRTASLEQWRKERLTK